MHCMYLVYKMRQWRGSLAYCYAVTIFPHDFSLVIFARVYQSALVVMCVIADVVMKHSLISGCCRFVSLE